MKLIVVGTRITYQATGDAVIFLALILKSVQAHKVYWMY